MPENHRGAGFSIEQERGKEGNSVEEGKLLPQPYSPLYIHYTEAKIASVIYVLI